MKKILFIFIACLFVNNFSVAKAEDKVRSITTQTNVIDYVLESLSSGIKRVSISPDGSALIQDSKNEKEFEQFLLKNMEELPKNSSVLINLRSDDNYYTISIIDTNDINKYCRGIGKNFSEALKSLEYKLDLDIELN